MSELVATADHECVECVFGIELGCGFPIEARLRRTCSGNAARGSCGSSAVPGMMIRGLHRNGLRWRTLRNYGWIFFNGDKLKIFEFEAHVIDGLKDQVAVLISDVTELSRGYADKHHLAHRMAEAGGFEPGFVRMMVNFLFQGAENAHPWVYLGCC